ncbi:hypothetical protein EON63_03810 [archaeon]|nr:MAG: hypothetical protein EON63_03810 [archaeon]
MMRSPTARAASSSGWVCNEYPIITITLTKYIPITITTHDLHISYITTIPNLITINQTSTPHICLVYHLLGHQRFQEGLINYMKQYAYSNTSTPDLWGAWAAVSGKDVQGIMEVWTKQTGYPYLKVCCVWFGVWVGV